MWYSIPPRPETPGAETLLDYARIEMSGRGLFEHGAKAFSITFTYAGELEAVVRQVAGEYGIDPERLMAVRLSGLAPADVVRRIMQLTAEALPREAAEVVNASSQFDLDTIERFGRSLSFAEAYGLGLEYASNQELA